MKKIFNNQKPSCQPNEVINTANYTIGQNYSHFIGRTFQLSKHGVCVEEVIGEGGFSIVFLVKSNLNGKKYALKRMYVNNPTDLEACKSEIKIIKSLSEHHKNILKYVDSSIQRQTDEIYEILLLTKYCKLGGLVQLINERLGSGGSSAHLQENEIIKIFCDVCEAVAALHENAIIHRDLKTENILIDTSETDKKQPRSAAVNPNTINYVLCDFGSATTQVFDRRLNSSVQSVQLVADEIQKYTTLSYRSPEMVDLYSNKLITTKSDIWALGCLLYNICYFQMPFGESQLAIQEGRFTIPDAKANYFSKSLNSLINYMLDTEPTRRPDIYQVSHLAFLLAQRPCPVKNFENSETPSFSTLSPPLTESEWRNMSQQLKKQMNTGNANSADGNATTTVNPRERPKGNLNNVGTILPLADGAGSSGVNKPRNVNQPNQVNSAKLTLSIKPPICAQPPPQLAPPPQLQQPIGFDDDFSTLSNPARPIQANPVYQTPQPHHQVNIPTSSSSDFMHDSSNDSQLKKAHRRSASHSSTGIFTSPNATSLLEPARIVTPHLANEMAFPNRLTPTQLLYQQQQQYQYNMRLQQQQMQQLHLQHQQQQLLVNPQLINQLVIPNHSRSSSASPNVPKPILAAHHEAAPVMLNKLNEEVATTKPNDTNNNTTSRNNNPFGDSFSQLNDNEIFGLEFDRIRHSNEKSSTSALPTGDLLNLADANQLIQMQEVNKQAPKAVKSSRRGKKELAAQRSASSSSSELQRRPTSSSSSSSSSYRDSTEKKYSSASTIVSVDSAMHLNKQTNNAANKIVNKKALKAKKKDSKDPFRKAPFRLPQTSLSINMHSSGSSSSNSLSNLSRNQASVEQVNQSINKIEADLETLKQPSAFQPYKRQNDPFVGAPFEAPLEKTQPSTPTILNTDRRRRTTEKKSNCNQEKANTSIGNEANKNEEIIQVISNASQLINTPVASAKKSSNQNPFINAPFTVKKSKPSTSLLSSTLDNAAVTSANIFQTPTFTDRISPTVNDEQVSNFSRQLNLNTTNEPVRPTPLPKIPQSHSLNEIKQVNEATPRTHYATHLIQQFNQKAAHVDSLDNRLTAEPLIDTSRLEFKKKSSLPNQEHQQQLGGHVHAATNRIEVKMGPAAHFDLKRVQSTKTTLTKSQSQNESLTTRKLPNKNNNSNMPGAASGGGGIANMSFDDY